MSGFCQHNAPTGNCMQCAKEALQLNAHRDVEYIPGRSWWRGIYVASQTSTRSVIVAANIVDWPTAVRIAEYLNAQVTKRLLEMRQRQQSAAQPQTTPDAASAVAGKVAEWIDVQLEFGAGGNLEDLIRRTLKDFTERQTKQSRVLPLETYGGELWEADPKCDHVVIDAPGGGIKCTKCMGWFCY